MRCSSEGQKSNTPPGPLPARPAGPLGLDELRQRGEIAQVAPPRVAGEMESLHAGRDRPFDVLQAPVPDVEGRRRLDAELGQRLEEDPPVRLLDPRLRRVGDRAEEAGRGRAPPAGPAAGGPSC